jgi:chorismate mutase
MRKTVDGIDNELVRLIIRRLYVAKDIAAYKKAHSLPCSTRSANAKSWPKSRRKPEMNIARACETLFSVIFDLSRSVQHRITSGESPVKDLIKKALSETEPQFPVRPLVACQGVEALIRSLQASACSRPQHHVLQYVRKRVCRRGAGPLPLRRPAGRTQYGGVGQPHL